MPLFRRGQGQQPGRPERSLADLERSAIARLQAGDYAQAIQDLRQIISLDQNADWAYGQLAVAYHQQGQPEAALAAIELAIQRSPVDAALRRTHGQILESLDRLTEAADAYNAAAGLDPDDTSILVALSGLALKLHDPHAAERCLQAALSRAPSDEQLLVGLADLREQQGMLEGALDVLRRASALNTRSPIYHYRIGVLSERLGDLDAALAAYRRACDLAPSNVTYVAAMQNLLALRDQEQAEAHGPSSNLKRVQVDVVPPTDEPEVVDTRPERAPPQVTVPPEVLQAPASRHPVAAAAAEHEAQRASRRPAPSPIPTSHPAPTQDRTREAGGPASTAEPVAAPAAPATHISPPARPRTLEEYEAAVAADPGNARLHHELSIQYLRAGRIAEAKRQAQMAEQARSRRPGN